MYCTITEAVAGTGICPKHATNWILSRARTASDSVLLRNRFWLKDNPYYSQFVGNIADQYIMPAEFMNQLVFEFIKSHNDVVQTQHPRIMITIDGQYMIDDNADETFRTFDEAVEMVQTLERRSREDTIARVCKS